MVTVNTKIRPFVDQILSRFDIGQIKGGKTTFVLRLNDLFLGQTAVRASVTFRYEQPDLFVPFVRSAYMCRILHACILPKFTAAVDHVS